MTKVVRLAEIPHGIYFTRRPPNPKSHPLFHIPVTFSLAALMEATGLTRIAARNQLLRLGQRVTRVAPRQDFFLIVSPEHQVMGAPPATCEAQANNSRSTTDLGASALIAWGRVKTTWKCSTGNTSAT